MHIRLTSCAVIVVAALLCSLPASGAAKTNAAVSKEALRDAAVLANRAKTAFREGQFDEAARLFMRAYAMSPEAALVYNAARAYEEGGKVGDAVGLFRLYTTIADDPDGIADARERIRRLEAGRLGNGAGSLSPDTPAVPAADAAVAAPGSAVGKPVSATATAQPAAAAGQMWIWVAAGVSGLAVIGGATLLTLSAGGSRDANAMAIHSQADIQSYNAAYDDAARLRNLGWASIGLGTVAAGAAAWLWVRQPVAVTVDASGIIAVAGRF